LIEVSADDRIGRVPGEGPTASESARSAPPVVASDVVQRPPHDPVLYADSTDCADLRNAAEAIEPLAELCVVAEAQTPFLAGIVGPPGSGKSFALRRLVEAVENLAAAAGKTAGTPYLSRVVVVPIDAAGVSGDPAVAIASAAFAALERDRGGVSYAALADEAAHAGTDPQRAAAAAADRHDEIGKRLEAERAARDEVEAKRARLTEALLYETPGSRLDAFARANRASIEARLRRFDFTAGDPATSYRDLVRDLESVGAASRASLVVRSIWAYRSQARWLAVAAIAFALAFVLDQLRGVPAADWLRGLGATFAPAADWLTAHGDLLETAIEVAIALGLLALVLNVWRAVGFSALLFRGLRLLNQDVRERRRELDASAARLNQRVAMLGAEADAAAQHAQAAAKRAGGAKATARAPGPAFVRGPEAAGKAARSFFVELGRLMSAPGGASGAAPQRLVFAFDNLDALAPADSLRLIEAANTMLGPGCAAAVACDPAALASAGGGGEAARGRLEKFFQVVFNAQTLGLADGGRFAARLIGSNAVVNPLRHVDAGQSRLIEPLSQGEAALLTAIAPLAANTPRGVKRFLNAYRIARLSKAPRPAIALMLAVKQSGDGAANSAMSAALAGALADLPDPDRPPALTQATQAARAANGGAISIAQARAAWEIARRYALPD
jgi:hypothetical protein